MQELESRAGSRLDSDRQRTGPGACNHADPMGVRLIDYTRYGAWIGCVRCGRSWLIRAAAQT